MYGNGNNSINIINVFILDMTEVHNSTVFDMFISMNE